MLSYIKDLEVISDYLTIIYSPANNHYISGIIDDESIPLSGSANLGTSTLNTLVKVASGSIVSSIFGKRFTNTISSFMGMGKLQTVAETMIGYEEPSRLNIPLKIKIFPHTHGNGSVSEIIEACLYFTQHRKDNVVGRIASNLYSMETLFKRAKEQVMNGNLADFDPLMNQLVSFSVGEIINTDGIFFVENIVPEIVTEVDDNNTPLYVSVSINLTSYRIVTAEEIASWIKV